MRSARAVLALLALVAGCGGGGATNSPTSGASAAAQHVRASVEDRLGSLATPKHAGSSLRACSHLTRALQRSIDTQLRMRGEHATCRTFAAKWTGGSNPPGRLGAHVTAVAVHGDTATVTLKAPPDRESEVKLRRVGSRWLIDNY
jgi:hypothetical protein